MRVGGQLLRNRAFLKPLSSLLLVVSPRPFCWWGSLSSPTSQMRSFDLGLFSGQKARATAWHSFWEGGSDREGLAHSQNFSVKLKPWVTCLRCQVNRKEGFCETQQTGSCHWRRYSRNPPFEPPLIRAQAIFSLLLVFVFMSTFLYRTMYTTEI